MNQEEFTIKDMNDDFKLKKSFGLHGYYKKISAL